MSPDPHLAADIVNALVTSYIEQNYQTKFESTTQTSDWLSQQLADLRVKVETSQEKLIRFQQAKGIVGIDDKQNTTTEKLGDLNKELTAAESDRIQKDANYRLASTGSPDLLGRSTDMLQNLRVREGTLKQDYALLGTQFGSSHPKVRETKNQLDQVQSDIRAEVTRIATQIQNEYLTALQRESMVRAELEQQKHEVNQLAQDAIEFNILKRDVDANRQLYEGLLQKMKEASIEVGLRSSNIRVVDSARVPLSPSTPDVPRNLGMGLLVGLCGGIGLAFLLETLDNCVYTPEQVEMASGLRVIGVVPMFAHPDASRLKPAGLALAKADLGDCRFELLALTRPNSEVAESYRALRTSILLSAPEAPPRVILVTSALPQEGKTTTCANASIVLAQRGMRVLLVDADLRRPGVHKAFGVGCETGLSTLLTGNSTMEEVIIRYPKLPNLCLLPAGPQPPAPSELISSLQMKALLAQWRKDFDHIIIDSPPAISVTDPVILSAEVDSVILVVRSGKTPKDALQRAEDLLFQVNARVMGVILNAINLASPGHYYYYHGVNGSDGYHNSEVVSGK
jgi:capsular exopolysaccharide synthesis family protein